LATKSGDYCPDAGDLIWIDLSPIVTSTKYDAASGPCAACPITRRVRGYPFEVAMPDDAAARGVVLSNQARSLSWQERYLQQIDRAPRKLVADARERIAAPLDIG